MMIQLYVINKQLSENGTQTKRGSCGMQALFSSTHTKNSDRECM